MLEKIKAIRKALKDENPYVALALALTLPDICGQIEYLDKKVGERYEAWFNNNVLPRFYKINNGLDFNFDGKMCYQLRCSYLHSGNSDVGKCVDGFKLTYHRGTTCHFFNKYTKGIDNSESIEIDVNGLCYFLCMAAENYYKEKTDKAVFAKYSLQIICYNDKDYQNLFVDTP